MNAYMFRSSKKKTNGLTQILICVRTVLIDYAQIEARTSYATCPETFVHLGPAKKGHQFELARLETPQSRIHPEQLPELNHSTAVGQCEHLAVGQPELSCRSKAPRTLEEGIHSLLHW